MAGQKDIYLSAQILIKRHGEAAEELALAKMRSFMDTEDVAAASAWLMIAQTISELNQHTPKATIH